MALTGTISALIDLKDDRSADVEQSLNLIKKGFGWTVTDGTTSDKADRVFADTRTLAASGTEALDLIGALTNQYGTVTFTKIKCVLVMADRANTNEVQVTRTTTTGVLFFMADGDGVALKPGGMFMVASPITGYTNTDTTDDTITITNSAAGTSVTYTIVIVGTSA